MLKLKYLRLRVYPLFMFPLLGNILGSKSYDDHSLSFSLPEINNLKEERHILAHGFRGFSP